MDPRTPERHEIAHEHAANIKNYSVFAPAEKSCITSPVSYAALFSTFSSFMPAGSRFMATRPQRK